jgi:hypothetical protein
VTSLPDEVELMTAMNPLASRRPRRAPRLLPALALAVAGWSAFGVAAEPTPQERAALRRQLDEARSRLDVAARDVAELTGKLYGGDGNASLHGFRQDGLFGPPRGAMLGINIGGDANATRSEGVEVVSVSPSGPAEAAGLRKGDVIMAADGKPLAKTGDRSGARQLAEHIRGVEPGAVVKLDYLRDGRKSTASVTTVAAEPPLARLARDHLPMLEGLDLPVDLGEFLGGPGRGFRSLELVPITPKLGQYFGTDKGLLVVRAPATPGLKLEEGDVILTIGGRTPENPRHAFRILGSYEPSELVKVDVLRQRKRLTLDVALSRDTGSGPAMRAPTSPRPPPPVAPPAASPATPRASSSVFS